MPCSIGLGKLSVRLGRRLLRWYRGNGEDSTSLAAGILFYRRLAFLGRLELEHPAETQGEFASRGKLPRPPGVDPRRSPSRTCRSRWSTAIAVRFGHLELDPASLQELNTRLDALEASLSSDK